MSGLFYSASPVELDADQAAGTKAIVERRDSRQALKIIPPADCQMAVTSGQTMGEPVYGGVVNSFLGSECPVNPIFLIGLSAGDTVQIWEA